MSGVVSGFTGAAPFWHNVMSYLWEGKKAVLPNSLPTLLVKQSAPPRVYYPQVAEKAVQPEPSTLSKDLSPIPQREGDKKSS